MKIVDKYMVRGFIGPFIWCVFVFTVMAVIADIFSFIDDIVKNKIPFASIISFYYYYAPTIMIQVIPMASLLSAIFSLSNLNKHNEIIAMKSSGISLWKILSSFLILGFIISLSVLIINEKIVPPTARKAAAVRREELEKERRKETQTKIVKNVALYGTGNRIIFAVSYDTLKKTLYDIIIHEHDPNGNLISKITAGQGTWTENGWLFTKVVMWRVDNSGQILGQPDFSDSRILPLKETPSDFANTELRSDFMSYKQLKKHIGNFRGMGIKALRDLKVDLHYKIAFSFISLIIILIGAPFALITTRGGVMIGVGMSIVIGLAYYAFIAISLAFGKAGVLPPPIAAWLGNFVFACLGIYLVNKRS